MCKYEAGLWMTSTARIQQQPAAASSSERTTGEFHSTTNCVGLESVKTIPPCTDGSRSVHQTKAASFGGPASGAGAVRVWAPPT